MLPMSCSSHDDATVATCNETRHVYFLKVHKAGSTCVQNLFWRFGVTRHLDIMLFRHWFPYPKRNFITEMLEYGIDKYDVFCEHSIFDERILQQRMPPDTAYVAIVREPMSQLRSVFSYYTLPTLLNLINQSDPIAAFLADPEYYVRAYNSRAGEVTRNRIAMEFGYTGEIDGLVHYLRYIDSKFVVLVLEQLDESLVVLKRKMCWRLKDVLYLPMRTGNYYHEETINSTLVASHRAWSPTDYVIYDYFHRAMRRRIKEQRQLGDDFEAEVYWFRRVSDDTKEFCTNVCERMGLAVAAEASKNALQTILKGALVFEESRWESSFTVTGHECLMMMFSPIVYRRAQRERQEANYFKQNKKESYHSQYFMYTFSWDILFKTKDVFLYSCYER